MVLRIGLNLDKIVYQSHFFELLYYQDSDAGSKIDGFQLTSRLQEPNCVILIREIKQGVFEKSNFE